MSEISPIVPAPAVEGTERASPASSTGNFGDALARAIGSVDQLQGAADQQATALAEGAGNLHETSIALSKAEVGMHFMMQIRNKVVEAYQDIMKMTV